MSPATNTGPDRSARSPAKATCFLLALPLPVAAACAASGSVSVFAPSSPGLGSCPPMSSFTVYTNNSIYKVELCGGSGEKREHTVRYQKNKRQQQPRLNNHKGNKARMAAVDPHPPHQFQAAITTCSQHKTATHISSGFSPDTMAECSKQNITCTQVGPIRHQKPKENHSLTDWFGLEGTLKFISFYPLPRQQQGHLPHCPKLHPA